MQMIFPAGVRHFSRFSRSGFHRDCYALSFSPANYGVCYAALLEAILHGHSHYLGWASSACC